MIQVHDLAHTLIDFCCGCGILDLIDVRSRDTEETSLEVDISASTHSLETMGNHLWNRTEKIVPERV
jgi:tRNA1(Val) A37 N6-methylase TrmN6